MAETEFKPRDLLFVHPEAWDGVVAFLRGHGLVVQHWPRDPNDRYDPIDHYVIFPEEVT